MPPRARTTPTPTAKKKKKKTPPTPSTRTRTRRAPAPLPPVHGPIVDADPAPASAAAAAAHAAPAPAHDEGRDAGRDAADEPASAPSRELLAEALDRQAEARRIRALPAHQRRYRTEWVPIELVRPADYNPRLMAPEDANNLATSLDTWGQVEPLVVNTYPGREGIIIGGHQRLTQQLDRAWEQTEVKWIYADLVEERQLNLALNRIHGDWDVERLAGVFEELRDEGAELGLTGFSPEEIDELLGASEPDGDEDLDDNYEAGDRIPARAQSGDVWECSDGGPLVHRLMCGDATVAGDVTRLMDGAPIDFIFTSPPYNVGVGYATHDDETVPWAAYGEFLSRVVRAFMPHLEQGRAVGWNIGSSPKTFPHHQYLLLELEGLTYCRSLIWQKVGVPVPLWHNTRDNPVARQFTPNYTHEWVGLFSKGALRRGGPVGVDDTLENDVFTIHQTLATSELPSQHEGTRTGAQSHLETRAIKVHPAAFPVRLPAAFITHLADVGAVVYEPFAGSGSTLVAGHKLGRRVYGMELSERYCDVVLDRLERLGLSLRLVWRAGAPAVAAPLVGQLA